MDPKNVSSSNYKIHMLLTFIKNTDFSATLVSFIFLLGIKSSFPPFCIIGSDQGVVEGV